MIGPVPTHWGGGAGWRGGGVATHVQGLLTALPSSQVRVRLLADNTDISQRLPFPELSPTVEFQAMARLPRDLLRLGVGRSLRLFERMVADAEMRRSAPLGQLARFWGQTVNFDYFLAGHRADVVHVHRAYHRQYLCQQVLRVTRPLIVTIHSVNALLEPNPAWVRHMMLTNYRRADTMIAVSNFVKRQIVARGADPQRITVITNGVDADRFAPQPKAAAREQLGLPADAFIVLFAGNLIQRKGVDVLIKAFSRCAAAHPQARLVVIGTGEEEDSLVQLASEAGVAGRVTFAGYKRFSEMPLWHQASDLFIMPSWAEGLSMSILEAMACGRAVITSRPDAGEHDAVTPERTGLLTNYGDVEELARALDRLMSTPELAERMGRAARQVVERRFRWDPIAHRTAQVYRQARTPDRGKASS